MKPHTGILLGLCFAGFILFFRLGSFGIFEPLESSRVETVESLAAGGKALLFPLPVEERIAATLTSTFGTSEFVLRLPSVFFALLSVLLTYVVLLPFIGAGGAATAGLMLCGSSLWLLHGRQLTSAMPTIAAEIAALGGGMTAVFSTSKSRRSWGIFLAAVGIALGSATRGFLVGAAPSALATVFAALSCDLVSKNKDATGSRNIVIAAAAVGVAAVGIYAATLLFSMGDIPLITGKETNTPLSKHTFEFAFEQIVYGWFPLCALVPAAISGIFRSPSEESSERAFVRTFAVYAILLEYAAQVISLKVNGIRFAACALPMAILITLAVEDLVWAEAPRRLAVFISAALLTVLVRDFAQNNQTLFYGYGYGDIGIPKDDTRVVVFAGLFAIPSALLILYGFLPTRMRKQPLSFVLRVLAPISFAVCVTFFLVPRASMHLSSKHGVMMVEKYRIGTEPLAVLGKSGMAQNAKKMNSLRETAEWLAAKERAFALFAPKDLPAIDHALRAQTGRQVFVLEQAGDRFILAVSKPLEGEKNVSPLKDVVQSTPFEHLPHASEINFDDVLTLLGWQLESEGDPQRLMRGQDLIFTSYWRVDGTIPKNYKMFMHFDGPGGRMHGDHDLFEGNFPTSTWQKGDFIKETFRQEVPVYQGKGDYSVRMGLFNDAGRLKIKDVQEAVENALLLGNTVIE